ncbi:MAG: hypothetical protein JNJ46_08405 [Myxococcales bacterium]|nr:hypothetical protein [Myxococcales bacterium]
MPQPSASPAPLTYIRCTLDYPRLDDFVARYGRNLSRAGVFLPMREPLEIGSSVRFEIVLSDSQVALRGEGTVSFRAPFEPGAPDRLHGIGLRLSKLDGHSRTVIERALAYKAAHPALFFEPARDPILSPPSPFAFVSPPEPAQTKPAAAAPSEAPSKLEPAAKPVATKETPAQNAAPKKETPAQSPAQKETPAQNAAPKDTPASQKTPLRTLTLPRATLPSRATPRPSAQTPLVAMATPASEKTPVPSGGDVMQSMQTPKLRPSDSAQTPKIELPVPSAATAPRRPATDSTKTPQHSATTPVMSAGASGSAASGRASSRSAPDERSRHDADEELASLRSPGTARSAATPDASKRLQELLSRRGTKD